MAWAGSGAREVSQGVMADLSIGVDRTMLGHAGGPPLCPEMPRCAFCVCLYRWGLGAHVCNAT